MSDPSQIRAGMPVIASDGERIGTVDAMEGGDRIKLKRVDSPDGEHHFVPLSAVARVDEHVHLNQAAGALRSGWAGTATTAAAGTAGLGTAAVAGTTATPTQTATNDYGATHVRVEGENKDGTSWLPWLLGALALLALLIFGVRGCDDQERAAVQTTERTTTAAGTAQTTTLRDAATGAVLAREAVVLPNRQEVQLTPGTVNHNLQRYLAGTEATPRTFAFDRVHFPTASAALLGAERGDINDMARILQAYPNARVRMIGYTDARGDAAANQQLGAQRAEAVKAALVEQGVPANRVETGTRGEADPADTNATGGGQAENRRTKVEVLSR